jgi:hypothetical protein
MCVFSGKPTDTLHLPTCARPDVARSYNHSTPDGAGENMSVVSRAPEDMESNAPLRSRERTFSER